MSTEVCAEGGAEMNPGNQFGQEAIANMEIEMMTDLYNRYQFDHLFPYFSLPPSLPSPPSLLFPLRLRLSKTCHKKCIPPKYHEGDLSKGEAICVDRCVGKFMEVHDRIGKKLTSMYTQDQAAATGGIPQQGYR